MIAQHFEGVLWQCWHTDCKTTDHDMAIHRNRGETMDLKKNLQMAMGMGKRFGIGASIYDIYYRGMDRLLGLEGYRVVALGAENLVKARLPEGDFPQARELSTKEILAFGEKFPKHLPQDFVLRACARGDRCVAMIIDGELAAYCWFSRRPTEMDRRLEVRFDDSMVYQYKAFTFRGHRGKRLALLILKHALEVYANEGVEKVVAYIANNNFASLAAAKGAGFQKVGTVYVIRRRRWLKVFATRACLRAGVSIAKKTLPQSAPAILPKIAQ